jgi:hypothetical protein
MNQSFLTPDDTHSGNITQHDAFLSRQLEKSIGNSFHQSLDSVTQVLLSSCHWYFTTRANALTLIICCDTRESYYNIQKALYPITKYLQKLANKVNVSVSPPSGKGEPWHIIIDEAISDDEYFASN